MNHEVPVYQRHDNEPLLRCVDPMISHGRCADAGLDPDEWFPVSAEAGEARHEAAAAIAICNSCLVRAECLALSLRHWDIGQHGVWGGLVAAERAELRRRIAADRSGIGSALMSVLVTASAR
jgi:WhiB family redox-sensing transcriptional regulator